VCAAPSVESVVVLVLLLLLAMQKELPSRGAWRQYLGSNSREAKSSRLLVS